MRARVALSTLVLLSGCDGCQPEDTGTFIPTPDTDTEDEGSCGATEPEVSSVTIEPHGTISNGEGTFPAILIVPHVTDDDGDLHEYRVKAWWDDVIDGAVSPSGEPVVWNGSYGTNPCGIFTYEPQAVLGITGNPPYQTALEFGIVVLDAAGNPSNGGTPVVQTFTTPDESGNY